MDRYLPEWNRTFALIGSSGDRGRRRQLDSDFQTVGDQGAGHQEGSENRAHHSPQYHEPSVRDTIRDMSVTIVTRAGGVFWASAILLFAHATWVAPVAGPLEVGKTVTVQVGNGHTFPASETVVPNENLQMYAVAPSGSKSKLQPNPAGLFVAASYKVAEPGVHRFVFVQDRGVMSRTPQGLKPGGRDQNPGATQSMKMYRSAVAYAATSGAKSKSLPAVGLTFEMLPSRSGDSMTVTALLDSKPVSGAAIRAVWPAKPEQELGSTGSDGKFSYRIPQGASGQFLLVAALSEKAGSEAKYDTSSYSTALHLTW
jgi:uncharacterized GH25 family protein